MLPSSDSDQWGLCATSQGCPSGSTKTPEYPPHNVSPGARAIVAPAPRASSITASTSVGEGRSCASANAAAAAARRRAEVLASCCSLPERHDHPAALKEDHVCVAARRAVRRGFMQSASLARIGARVSLGQRALAASRPCVQCGPLGDLQAEPVRLRAREDRERSPPDSGAHGRRALRRKRREAHLRGRGRLAGSPAGCADPSRLARAGALDADGPRQWARSGRPPSRRCSRSRAILDRRTGTSGRGGTHRARSARTVMFAMTGTCVRKIRNASGRTAGRTGVRVCAWPRESALQSRSGARMAATGVARRASGPWSRRVPGARQVSGAPARTSPVRWLLRLPSAVSAIPWGPAGRALSSWRSS